MQSRWTVDGVVLALPAREGPAAVARLAWVAAGTVALACIVALGFLARPPPAPVCATAQLCRDHLPPELNPDPPERDAWVEQRVSEVLESVTTEDRLPSDIDVVDHLSLESPGTVEWAFLAAEHAERSVIAEVPEPGGVTGTLRTALQRYRDEAGQERVHFQDATRFVAEITAVRSAVDRQQARARLDELAAEHHSVLDLGLTSAREVVAAASAVAGAEWEARRSLERVRLAEVTARLVESRTRADVAWLFGMTLGAVFLAFAVGGTAFAGVQARRSQQPVRIEVGGRGIRLDGTWIDRESIVWVGLRDGAFRVVTRDADRVSRAVVDDRALHAALKQWRKLAEQGGAANPADEARVRRLIR
ncbi:MAG: hypothetical protein H6737_19350 [Alphaproteobacteria bacterium]|nr:hypothetical protein [Alphaproteobacteria bacterium]